MSSECLKLGVPSSNNSIGCEVRVSGLKHHALFPFSNLQIPKFSNQLIFDNPFHYTHLVCIALSIDIEYSKLIDIIDPHLT